MNQVGSIVPLTLPSNVFVNPDLRPRFATMGNYTIIVNSPSRPLTVDANLNVRLLAPDPPVSKIVLSGVAGGTLSGTFRVRQTYVVFDAFGNLISESDFGPTSDAATISNQDLLAANINVSPDQVSARRLYRTTTGTAVYFQWIDATGNEITAIQDDLSDAGLATFSAPSMGSPPDMYVLAEFKSRLFGVSKADPNRLLFSDIARPWAWPGDNTEPVPRIGSDNRGVTGLVRRRDALGVGRANGFYQITGTSDANLRFTNISENMGIEATDSIAVYRDVGFFVWKDGVYKWDTDGIKCVSDDKVRSWFTKNSTFNLSRLPFAFGSIIPNRHFYRVFLASAGSSTENCWFDYDFVEDKFWGPHTSHAMNPSCAFQLSTDAGSVVPMIGATDGFIRIDRENRTDDSASDLSVPIDFDVVTARNDLGLPDDEKYFGELSVATTPQPRGTLTVTTVAGELDEPRSQSDNLASDEADLTKSRSRLGRVGVGKAFKARFRNNEPGVDVELRGFEINPVSIVGKR